MIAGSFFNKNAFLMNPFECSLLRHGKIGPVNLWLYLNTEIDPTENYFFD